MTDWLLQGNNLAMDMSEIDAIIFDFDGVLTNNKVILDQNGIEHVVCHRGDGLAFDVFRKLKIKAYILSTEINPVVKQRAEKLKVPVIHGAENKFTILEKLCTENDFELSRLLYVGNDLNDYMAMKACGKSACPSDGHPKIKAISKYHLNTKGGEGVAREIVENLFGVDIVSALYST